MSAPTSAADLLARALPDDGLAGVHPAGAPQPAPRSVLALGLVGALGEELLALLVGSGDWQRVVVGVQSPMTSASPRFVPWQVGSGVPVVDEAWVALTGDETFVPSASPIRRYRPAQVVEAAQVARDCGARGLVVVSPLAALLQMGAGASTLGSSDELALVQLGFERLVVVRPTAEDAQEPGSLPARLVRAAARALADIMLPGYTRALSARTAARAILEAVRAAPPRGTTVYGARELMRIVQARMPELAPRAPRLR